MAAKTHTPIVGQENQFSPFDVFYHPHIQDMERVDIGDPVKDFPPSFAAHGWKSGDMQPEFTMATEAQAKEGKDWMLNVFLPHLRTLGKIVLFSTDAPTLANKDNREPVTKTGDQVADWIVAKYVAKLTYKYVANEGQRRTSQLLVSLMAWELFSPDRDISKFTIRGTLSEYADNEEGKVKAFYARLDKNYQPGRRGYSPVEEVGIARKALALGESPAQLARHAGWNRGKQQDTCDRARICNTFKHLSIFERMCMQPVQTPIGKGSSTRAESPIQYREGGYIPYSVLKPGLCRTALGRADKAPDDVVKNALVASGWHYRMGEQLSGAQLETVIKYAIEVGSERNPLGKSQLDTTIDLLSQELDITVRPILVAIREGDSGKLLGLVNQYIANHPEWAPPKVEKETTEQVTPDKVEDTTESDTTRKGSRKRQTA